MSANDTEQERQERRMVEAIKLLRGFEAAYRHWMLKDHTGSRVMRFREKVNRFLDRIDREGAE